MDSGTDNGTGPLAGGAPIPVGRFSWRVPEDVWWWSDETYALHGFEPGQVVPSTDLMLAHKHPDDLDHVREVYRSALQAPTVFSCYYRLVDARRREHSVLSVGESLPGDGVEVREVRGFIVDVTQARRADFRDEVSAAVEGATRHRAAIEQAKGVLMFVHGIDENAAFAMLRGLSSTSNTKLATLAERLAARLRDAGPVPDTARAALDEMLEQGLASPAPYDDLDDAG